MATLTLNVHKVFKFLLFERCLTFSSLEDSLAGAVVVFVVLSSTTNTDTTLIVVQKTRPNVLFSMDTDVHYCL